jgi:DNA-binding response OmpR family regulator/Tfp pilus assembly protein PilF
VTTILKKVLVVESRVDMRSTVRESVKSFKGVDVQITSDTQEAWNTLEIEEQAPDLIFTMLDLNDKVNTFHLVSIVIEHPKFANTRIIVTLNEGEKVYLTALFELGVMAYVEKPLTKQHILECFGRVNTGLSRGSAAPALTAAESLRVYLKEEKNWEVLIGLEKSLMAAFPQVSETMLSLAEAQHYGGYGDQAIQTLMQAKLMCRDHPKRLEELAILMGAKDLLIQAEGSLSEMFGIETVLVVDPDPQAAGQIEEALNIVGIDEPKIFFDGEAACAWLSEDGNVPDLIIHEWKIPKVSGAQLLQRVRHKYHLRTPLIVCSSLLEEQDELLVKEMGAAGLVKKPVRNENLTRMIAKIMRQESFPTDYATLERKIRAALETEKFDAAIELFKNFEAIPNKPPGITAVISAEISYIKGDYEASKNFAVEAFRLDGESVESLNILGKSFLKLGDQQAALKCLNRANEMNALNLHRLCNLAEANSEIGNEEGATSALYRAEKIDSESEMVHETRANIALNEGNVEKARKVMQSLGALDKVVQYMNNRAILLAREGELDTSLDLYQNAMRSLPNKSSKERNIILYNLALLFARMGEAQKSVKALKGMDLKTGTKLASKAKSLLDRAESAIKHKTELKLIEQTENSDTKLLKPVALHAKTGQYGLHMIFDCGAFEFMDIGEKLVNRPPFSTRVRDVIQRTKKGA